MDLLILTVRFESLFIGSKKSIVIQSIKKKDFSIVIFFCSLCMLILSIVHFFNKNKIYKIKRKQKKEKKKVTNSKLFYFHRYDNQS